MSQQSVKEAIQQTAAAVEADASAGMVKPWLSTSRRHSAAAMKP